MMALAYERRDTTDKHVLCSRGSVCLCYYFPCFTTSRRSQTSRFRQSAASRARDLDRRGPPRSLSRVVEDSGVLYFSSISPLGPLPLSAVECSGLLALSGFFVMRHLMATPR